MNEELKPCPFCGGKARLENDGLRKTTEGCNYEYFSNWRVVCTYCGIEKKGGSAIYRFCDDGSIKLVDVATDGRRTAIEKWNRRETENG